MEKIDWKSLPFGYIKTNYNVRCYYKNGAWGTPEISDSEAVNIHIAATCLHYGQEAFEGLKAFMGKDGKVRIFRFEENAKRMQLSAKGTLIEEITNELNNDIMIQEEKIPHQPTTPPTNTSKNYTTQ